jgi:hypothetical protein
MPTASSRTVFVLGKRVPYNNRTVLIVESGEEYSVSASTIVDYTTSPEARFPYQYE